MKKKRILILVIALGIIVGTSAFFVLDYIFGVYDQVVVEAGGQASANDFLKHSVTTASFVKGDNKIDYSVPGKYPVTVKSGIFSYDCVVMVEDTIAPIAQKQEVTVAYGEKQTADLFVTEVMDATDVTISFEKEPNWQSIEPQAVTIVIKDLGGNETKVASQLIVSPVASEISAELGSEFPSVSDFLLVDCEASIISDVASIDMNGLGEHSVSIEANGNVFTSKLCVIDTIAPEMALAEGIVYQGTPLDPMSVVASVYDLSESITYEISGLTDTQTPGNYDIQVTAKDASGNSTTGTTKLTVLEDTEAPQFLGLSDTVTFIGDSYSYKTGVVVTDNSGVDLAFEVEASSVNLSLEGIYQATYKVSDYAGNTTEQTITIEVKKHEYSLEQVNELADEILNKIITPDMSAYEQCRAIYTWVRQNVGYINHTDKEDYLKAAYEGFTKKQGDCFGYYAVSKVLLTQAGIENMDIEKIPSRSTHYWNLVNIGDGWYHFDTTPRTTGAEFFMLTDEQMMSYSEIHYGSHNYNKDLFSNMEWGTTEYHDFNPRYSKPKPEASTDGAVDGGAAPEAAPLPEG